MPSGGEQTGHYPGSAEAGRGQGDSWNSGNITIISCLFCQPWSGQSASKDSTIIENIQQQRGGVTILFQVIFFFIYVSIISNTATRKQSGSQVQPRYTYRKKKSEEKLAI